MIDNNLLETMNNPIIPFYKQLDKHIVRSKDCYLFEADGKRYIDFESGDWAANIGHSNDEVIEVLKQQADSSIHDGLRFKNKPSEELSLVLSEKLGLVDGKCAFVNSGSEAVNLGIMLARNLTGRRKVLKMDVSYLSAYGYGQISPHNPDLLSVPIDNIDALSSIDFGEVAAFVFEPGNSSSLIKYPGNEFIKAVALKVKRAGGLLMANEVTTGFGRTGKWFGFQHYDFKPDIVSVGKALGNGYPVSGVAISSEVAALFDKSPFRYAQSHQNDPLGCTVGLKVVEVIKKNNLINQASEKGTHFNNLLIELQKKYPARIREIRARGLMIGVELDSVDFAGFVYNQLINNGFLAGLRENVIRFMPPLIIPKTDIEKLVRAMDVIMSESTGSKWH